MGSKKMDKLDWELVLRRNHSKDELKKLVSIARNISECPTEFPITHQKKIDISGLKPKKQVKEFPITHQKEIDVSGLKPTNKASDEKDGKDTGGMAGSKVEDGKDSIDQKKQVNESKSEKEANESPIMKLKSNICKSNICVFFKTCDVKDLSSSDESDESDEEDIKLLG